MIGQQMQGSTFNSRSVQSRRASALDRNEKEENPVGSRHHLFRASLFVLATEEQSVKCSPLFPLDRPLASFSDTPINSDLLSWECRLPVSGTQSLNTMPGVPVGPFGLLLLKTPLQALSCTLRPDTGWSSGWEPRSGHLSTG